MNLKELSDAETPKCGDQWLEASELKRKEWVLSALVHDPEWARLIEIADLRDDGQVIIRLTEPLGTKRRGGLLLDFEAHLKNKVDNALNIWLEPLGDRSSLRRLRGIEVKL